MACGLKAQTGDTALARIMSLENDTDRVNQLYKKGYALRHSRPQQAYEYALLCKKEADASGSPRHVATSYNLLGILAYKRGEISVALRLHGQALQIRLAENDLVGQANSQTNLGNIYSNQKMYGLAETSYLQSLALYDSVSRIDLKARALVNLGTLKQETNDLQSADEYYKLAFKLAEQSNDYEIRCICLNNMADLFYNKKEYEKSIGYNMDALELRNLMDNQVECTDSYLGLAENYLALKEYGKARTYLDKAYKVSNGFDYFEGKMEASRLLAEYYQATAEYEKALKWIKDYYKMQISVLNEESGEAKAEELQKNRNLVLNGSNYGNSWLAVLIVVCVVLFPVILWRYKR